MLELRSALSLGVFHWVYKHFFFEWLSLYNALWGGVGFVFFLGGGCYQSLLLFVCIYCIMVDFNAFTCATLSFMMFSFVFCACFVCQCCNIANFAIAFYCSVVFLFCIVLFLLYVVSCLGCPITQCREDGVEMLNIRGEKEKKQVSKASWVGIDPEAIKRGNLWLIVQSQSSGRNIMGRTYKQEMFL